MFKVIDLFAGCGGLTLGFQNAGFDVLLAADNWNPAIHTYRENFDHEILKMDLEDWEKCAELFEQYKPDVIIGGPPCQDFSHAGQRNEDGGRGNLTVAYANIVSKIRPRWFVMENVDRLVKTKKYAEAEKIFKEAGYGLNVRLLDASLCGVPQKRKRYFVVGELDTDDNFLDALIDEKMTEKPMTVRDYFGNKLGTEYYYRHPRNYNRRAVYSIDEPSATIRGVNRPIPDGYPGHPNDALKNLKKVRPLTTQERGEIQTFPKDFVWSGTKTSIEQLIGNAVPVKLAEFVANALMERIKASGHVSEKISVELKKSTRQMRMFDRDLVAA
jgi:DNA (cytosine-5)-methyltransferase 1